MPAVLFGAGASWSFLAGRAPSPWSQLSGSVARGVPSPESEQWRVRQLNKRKMSVMLSKVTSTVAQDGGSPELRFVDFPTAEGLHRIQGVKDAVAAARQRHVLQLAGGVELQKDLFVISVCVLGFSVRTLF